MIDLGALYDITKVKVVSRKYYETSTRTTPHRVFLTDTFNKDLKKTNITVGSSSSRVKTVTLPYENMVISRIPANWQDRNWRDRFSTSVSGKTLTVTRIDQDSGWGRT